MTNHYQKLMSQLIAIKFLRLQPFFKNEKTQIKRLPYCFVTYICKKYKESILKMINKIHLHQLSSEYTFNSKQYESWWNTPLHILLTPPTTQFTHAVPTKPITTEMLFT